jgi:hypothetical protein
LAVKEATKAVEDVVDSSWHWMVLPPSWNKWTFSLKLYWVLLCYVLYLVMLLTSIHRCLILSIIVWWWMNSSMNNIACF